MPRERSNTPDECVGSLLVHQQDMRELSSPTRVTREAVGSLLVPLSDMKELSGQEEIKPAVVDAEDEWKQPPVTLIRRITKTMMGPPPDDADSDLWAD